MLCTKGVWDKGKRRETEQLSEVHASVGLRLKIKVVKISVSQIRRKQTSV